jgi:UDP-N-acetylmuramoyl-L-alanyl-D-glutamate--2,6-diaminopimelate ligase
VIETILKKELYLLTATNKPNLDSKDNQVNLELIGEYNVYNALCSFGISLGGSIVNNNSLHNKEDLIKKISNSLSKLKGIEGRMEPVLDSPHVLVDFAHTPNGMESALHSIKKHMNLNGLNGNLWVIFGCAGMRDHYKRPVMGKISFDNADRILVVPEDPRTEKVQNINDQIIKGMDINEKGIVLKYNKDLTYKSNQNKLVVRFDEFSLDSRKNAIDYAIKYAHKHKDLVILLGKGHETSMCFGTKEIDWNDIKYIKDKWS